MFRRRAVPLETWFVLYKMVLTLVVFSPFAFGAKATISLFELLFVTVLLPIEFLALDHWRSLPQYRLHVAPTLTFGIIGTAVIAIEMVAHEPPLRDDVLKFVVWLVLMIGPVSLIADALARRRAGASISE